LTSFSSSHPASISASARAQFVCYTNFSLIYRVVDFGIVDRASTVVLANVTLDNVFVIVAAFVRLVVVVDVITLRISHGALAQSGATLESTGQFIVATFTGTALGIATTRNFLFAQSGAELESSGQFIVATLT